MALKTIAQAVNAASSDPGAQAGVLVAASRIVMRQPKSDENEQRLAGLIERLLAEK